MNVVTPSVNAARRHLDQIVSRQNQNPTEQRCSRLDGFQPITTRAALFARILRIASFAGIYRNCLTTMDSLELWQYGTIALGALLVGFGKGGLPGVGNLTVVLMALVLPPKASVGVLLPILISADVIAVLVYRRHAEWRYIFRLAPWMVAGILIGSFVFGAVNDAQVRFLIGLILLSMTAIHLYRKWLRRRSDSEDALPHHPIFIASTGIIGGFATMMANAAGPVAALYFIASGLPKYAYIGTAAWFFLLVNLFKVPFMMQLQIIDTHSLLFSTRFMLFSILGAAIAPLIVKHINQKVFEILIWFFVIVGGLKLVIP
jgi:uncharacterized membrane protein YfcA